MKAEFTIKNYRCFDDSSPLRLTVENGFIAFVGPNNSGKSSILKFFHEFGRLWSLIAGPTGNLANLMAGKIEGVNLNNVIDPSEIFCNTNKRELVIEVSFTLNKSVMPQISKVMFIVQRHPINITAEFYVDEKLRSFSNKNGDISFHENQLNSPEGRIDLTAFFETFSSLQKATYLPSFRYLINVGGGNYYDMLVGTHFVSQWDNWSVGPKKSLNSAVQKITEDIGRIFGYEKLQITASRELNTLQIYIDEKPYKLQELGAGIAQFILVLGNAAIRQPSFILIDEPELNLHPSLQLDFLTALTAYSKNGVLFATHSIGLARAAADKIYSVRKDGKRSIVEKFEQTGNLSEFLGELSFSSFKELGFDKILLIEGVKDVKTVQQFLRLFKKDHEIVLMPLGGSQMINGAIEHELNEIKRISGNIFALIDSEKDAKDSKLPPQREKFKIICEKLGINIHILERRAIENYFTDDAIKIVKGNKYNALGPFEKLENSSMPWSKTENWRVAYEMTLDDIKDTDLYEFLKEI